MRTEKEIKERLEILKEKLKQPLFVTEVIMWKNKIETLEWILGKEEN